MLFVRIPIGPGARVRQKSNSVWTLRTGGGVVLTLFGLPFLLSGLFCLVMLVFWTPLSILRGNLTAQNLWAIPLVLLIFGGVGFMFTIAGSMYVFGRSGATIDRKGQTVDL